MQIDIKDIYSDNIDLNPSLFTLQSKITKEYQNQKKECYEVNAQLLNDEP